MDLNPDWNEFLRSLNEHHVDYVVVGAVALAFHGHPRLTGDIDVLIRREPSNIQRLLNALEQFGFGSINLISDDFLQGEQVIQLGRPPRRIDLLTWIDGVSFEEAWADRVVAEFPEVRMNLVGRACLLKNKRATGRTKDLADVEALEGSAEAQADA
jgi:hypothetical protein